MPSGPEPPSSTTTAGAPSTAAEDRAQVAAPLLREIFARFDNQPICWAILRGAAQLPDSAGRDVDILVATADLAAAKRIVREVAARQGWVELGELVLVCHAIWLVHPQHDYCCLPIELFESQSHRGAPLTNARRGLEGRRKLKEGLWVVPPGFSSATTALKEIVAQGTLKESARPEVQEGALLDPEGFMAAATEAIGKPQLVRDILQACQAGQWDALPHYRGRLRSAIRWRLAPGSIYGRLRYLGRVARSRLRPLGLCVVFIGPDGCGKSTIAEGLVREARGKPFAHSHLLKNDFAILPRLKELKVWAGRLIGRKVHLPPPAPPGTPNAGMTRPNSLFMSAVYVTYYALDLFLGRMRLATWQATVGLVVFDRYFLDYYYQRANSRLPRWYLNLCYLLVPKPDLIVYLHRDPADIFAQKPELSVREIQRQQDCIQQMLAHDPRGRVMDASGGIEQTIRRVREAVNQRLLPAAAGGR